MQITEIKKGQTGTGLLLENDGFVSLELDGNKILKESINNNEAYELPRPFIVSAVFQKFGIENANGRIYPESILKREVERYQQVIKERRAYGEMQHPQDSGINPERICMNIVELHWEGHTLVGKIEIPISEGFRRYGICSTLADTAAQWIVSGLKVGVSSRALGNVSQINGKTIVGDDLELICWDLVCDPSTPNAWISTNEKELERYIESDQTKKEKNVIKEDKYSSIENWLND